MPVIGLDGALADDVSGSLATSALTLRGDALEMNRVSRITEGRVINAGSERRVINLFFARGVL